MSTRDVTYACLPAAIATSGAGADWLDPANLLALDRQMARVPLAAGASSRQLDLAAVAPTTPGFRAMVADDPAQFVPTGLSVVIHRQTDVPATARDVTVQRLDSGTPIGTNLALTGVNWPSARGAQSYGGGPAVWGSLPSLAEILDGRLGLRIAATNVHGSASCLAQIDAVEILLTLTQPALPPFRDGGPPALADIRLIPPPNQLEDLLRTPGATGRTVTDPIWLVELSGIDEAAGTVESFFWCTGPSGGVRLDADGDGIAERQYDAVLTQPIALDYRLFSRARAAGEGTPSSGRIVALNLDGRFDRLRRLVLDGRTVTVRLGAPHLRYGSYATVFTLVIVKAVISAGAVELQVQDRRRALDAAYQPIRFAANHAVPEIRNAVMPQGFGEIGNVAGTWVGAATVQLGGDFPFKEIVETRADGKVIANPGTIDATNGTATFASLPAGRVTFTLRGTEARNIVKESRDATAATWFRTNCTAARLAFGIDGTPNRGFRLTATAAGATCNPTIWESPATPVQWGYAVMSVYMRLLSGAGLVQIFNTAPVLQLTRSWRRYFVVVPNPVAALGGITILTSGDQIECELVQVEPARWYPSPPIDTTGAAASVRNYPESWAAIVKFLLTTRSGLVPFIDFDETAFLRAAQKNQDKLALWYDREATVLDAVGLVLDSVGGGLVMDRQGRAVIDRAGLPERAPEAVLTARSLFEGASLAEPRPKAGRVVVRHARNHAPQPDSLDPSLSAAVRERYAREWIDAVAEDAGVLAAQGDTADATVILPTALTETAAAARRALAELELVKVKRTPMILPTDLGAALLDPMRCVRVSAPTLTHDRGSPPVIVDLMVRNAAIDAAAERVTLSAWG